MQREATRAGTKSCDPTRGLSDRLGRGPRMRRHAGPPEADPAGSDAPPAAPLRLLAARPGRVRGGGLPRADRRGAPGLAGHAAGAGGGLGARAVPGGEFDETGRCITGLRGALHIAIEDFNIPADEWPGDVMCVVVNEHAGTD